MSTTSSARRRHRGRQPALVAIVLSLLASVALATVAVAPAASARGVPASVDAGGPYVSASNGEVDLDATYRGVFLKWTIGDDIIATDADTTFNPDDLSLAEGTYTLTAWVSDGGEWFETDTAPLTVVPALNVGGPDAVADNASVQLTASTSPIDTTRTYGWDFDHDGRFDDATGDQVTLTGSSFDPLTELEVRAKILTGAGAGAVSRPKSMKVTETPPSASFDGAPYTVAADSSVTFGATPKRANANDWYEWEFDPRDNDGGEFYDSTARRPSFIPAKLGLGPGTYPVKLRYTSDLQPDPVVEIATTVTVTATVDAGGPYAVVEGKSVTLTATSSSPHAQDTLTWDLDGDGAYDDATGATVAYDTRSFGVTPGEHVVAVQLVSGLAGTATDTGIVTIQARPAVTSTKAPTIKGAVGFGRTLTAKPGSWSPSGVTLTYQWLRDGTPVKAATKATYKLGAADLGSRISVSVTGKKVGHKSSTVTSGETEPVRSKPTLTVTTTTQPGTVTFKVVLQAGGTTPAGSVEVTEGGQTWTAALDKGKGRTTASGLPSGRHSFVITYGGSDTVEPVATTRSVTVR